MSLVNIFKLNDIIKSDTNWYTVLKRLGNGGNGAAYLTLCTKGPYSGNYFVVKTFYKLEDLNRLQRFNKEIEFLKETNHPSIIKCLDNGIHHYYDQKTKNTLDIPFYIMQYMSNNLTGELKKGKLSIEKTLIYTTQLLSALSYMNKHNVVHRDIKPDNIFISGNKAILGDFGLIKYINSPNSEYSSEEDSDIEDIKESVFSNISDGNAMPRAFRSPHLVNYLNNKIQLTSKSDLFQCGLVICLMFTGNHPLRPYKNISDPVELKSLDEILRPLNQLTLGNSYASSIKKMVTLNEDDMENVDKLLHTFNITLLNYLKERVKLDSEIFL